MIFDDPPAAFEVQILADRAHEKAQVAGRIIVQNERDIGQHLHRDYGIAIVQENQIDVPAQLLR